MKISKFHLLTMDHPEKSHIDQITELNDPRLDWIQFRSKKLNSHERLIQANALKRLSESRGITLIINDDPELCKKVNADGVHLGKNDMNPLHARKILGSKKIIGATANTIEDIITLSELPIDYIGLGPYKFTKTKENLSPVLGLDSYRKITRKMKESAINIPLIAIGGIETTDTSGLFRAGISGIAVSSSIHFSNDPKSTLNQYYELIK